VVKNTVLMTSREQALKAQEKGMTQYKIVTLDGYVYIPHGPDISIGNSYEFSTVFDMKRC
jgi:chromosome segregation ATPase